MGYFGEALKSERAKGHLLARFGDHVRGRRRVKSVEHGPTVLVDLRRAKLINYYGKGRERERRT